MRESLYCEDLGFIRGFYGYDVYNGDIKNFYVRLIQEKVLKPRDFVWVKLQSAENKTIEGCVMRQKWKNLRRRNLTYQIGNCVKKLSEFLVSVDFRPYTYCDYSKPIQFDQLLPSTSICR